MTRCEDFPCCGHELGCCPDFDPETGKQLNMVCVCGAKLPVTSRYSICEGCMERGRDQDDYEQSMADEEYMEDEKQNDLGGIDHFEYSEDDPPDEPSDNMTDAEADADTLRSAGMGTDEDYGYYGDNDGY